MHDLGLRDYLQILRRRKWIVVQAAVIVPAVAVALSLSQSPRYQASADVLLRYQSLPSTLSGISDPNAYAYYIDPTRSTDTQLQIAELPVLADRVAAALEKAGVTPAEVAGSTAVGSVGDTDVIRFTSTSGDPTRAALLATAYARQFTLYHHELDTASITQAISRLQGRIAALQAQDTRLARSSAAQLQAKIDQLQTLKSLQTASAVVVRTAGGAVKVAPTPKKYGILGLGLGIVLGIGLAFLRDAFDTRLRTAEQIGSTLHLPLLARIPEPPRQLAKDKKLIMIAEPTSQNADAFRRLRMNLEFAAIGKPSQVIMLTSALPDEGKSTTLANLGVSLALAGKSVAVVELDLRKPMLSRLFRIDPSRPGLSFVALGDTSLDEALVHVPLEPTSLNGQTPVRPELFGTNGHGPANSPGSLSVLPVGVIPPDPGEFVGLDGVVRAISALRERCEVVLLDSPPLLAVGDGLTIGQLADAIVVAVRSDRARRQVTGELAAILARMPAIKLGYVLCGETGLDGGPYYGYGYGYRHHAEGFPRGEDVAV